jgi:AraC family transcriptional regulator
MPKSKTKHQNQFHRSQIGRAQRYIRVNLSEKLSLSDIAREAGSSSYHFARLFLAYTGETPFDFLRRIRLATALRMLQEDSEGPVTEIALSVGYETPSAFNKAFKKMLNLNPSDFRNLGQAGQYDVIYHLSKPRVQTKMEMNLSPNFEIVSRLLTHYVYLEKQGPFAEVAPGTWNDMFPLVFSQFDRSQLVEFLGLSTIDKTKVGEEALIYQAGVTLKSAPSKLSKGLQYKPIKGGKYARFLLTGPYSHVWIAFNQIFKTLAAADVRLRQEYCIENYLNDPQVTPEDKLLTELLVPTV